jgi:hypothetical protein
LVMGPFLSLTTNISCVLSLMTTPPTCARTAS